SNVYGTIAAGTLYYYYSQSNGGGPLASGDPTRLIPFSVLGGDYLPDHGNVVLGGTIYAAGFAGGGTLSLQAPTVRIEDGAAPITSYTRACGGAAGSATAPGTLVIPAAFFANNAFSSYSLTSVYGGVP